MKTSPLDGLRNYTQQVTEGSYRNKEVQDFKNILDKARLERQDDKKLKEACQELEAIFLHKMLQQMRAGIPNGGLIEESHASKIYKDMLDEQYSKLIAKSHGSIGIADMLYQQLKRDINRETLTVNREP